jgi:RloB-like protein
MSSTLIRKPRALGRNMVLVCEDSHTAPNYLFSLKKKAMDTLCWDYIEIYPKPPIDVETPESVENPHKTLRKKRNFKEIAVIEVVLEPENKEQPVNYVRTVQKVLEEGLYSEGWAIFDLDGHTGHERAASMAQESPIVNLAFSSRSIEIWFLLHFGQNDTAFQKVHCKDERKRPLNCSKTSPCLEDGKGDCLLGFIRRHTFLKNYQKNDDLFTPIEPYLRKALDNAAWLRTKYALKQAYFLRNPYTTMDLLVKRLLKWVGLGDVVCINDFEITVQKVYPAIELNVQNKSKIKQIIQKYHFEFDQKELEFEFLGNGILEVQQSRLVTLTLTDPHKIGQVKLKYPANNDYDFIWILC